MHTVKGKLTIRLPGRQKAETEVDAGEEESEEEPEVEDTPSRPTRGPGDDRRDDDETTPSKRSVGSKSQPASPTARRM